MSDISAYEQRAALAEVLIEQLVKRVELLEATLKKDGVQSDSVQSHKETVVETKAVLQTSGETVSKAEYEELLKEVAILRNENARLNYRIVHLLRSLEAEEAKNQK